MLSVWCKGGQQNLALPVSPLVRASHAKKKSRIPIEPIDQCTSKKKPAQIQLKAQDRVTLKWVGDQHVLHLWLHRCIQGLYWCITWDMINPERAA